MTSSTATINTQKKGRISLDAILLILIAAGILVSGYLTYVKFTAEPMACVGGGMFDCSTVQNSIYAEMFGIPIAYMGLATYIVMAGLIVLESRIGLLQEFGNLILFAITLFAWLFSMWLVYVQFFLLEALCQWCLTHEVLMTLILPLVCVRLWRSLRS